jgi:flagellar hook-basal body complex protein FliE
MDIDTNAIGGAGTYLPDIAPTTPAVAPLPSDDATTAATGSSFKDAVKSMLEGVNDKMVAADQASTDLATGKSNDFDGTVKALEEAGMAFQFTMSIRNKIMDAYSEVQQMQF